MKYDDSEYFFMNFTDDDLPVEAGATHIGMFMAWVIMHDLFSDDFHSTQEIEKVKSRKITGRDFVIDSCDGKLCDEDLSEEGNKFVMWYYESKYFDDYCKVFEISGDGVNEFCGIEDKWENFEKLTLVLDKRLNEWKKIYI